ncbi:MFS transporter [Nocardiopsis exhalans]|uniref:MFS transporter n=1 Tax=Nocardiopsis exhalans TaxID=163604 RepID=A0ABY5D7X6_9ACTN|nr:MFS transporter [Nocardiopsis exhalans]USY19593.1 MFS transporter [Nocardiopsis exhalans]
MTGEGDDVRAAERRKSVALTMPGLLLVMLLAPLDQTSVIPALPVIAGDLGGLDQIPAVITAYLVAATAVLPVYGRLGDRFGRKPLLLIALSLFVLGALLCTLAASFPMFVAARVVQGVGGGGLMIGGQATLAEIISPRERGRYLGLIGSVAVLPAVGGPLLGGVLVDLFSWRWIFAIHLPLGAVAFVVLVLTLRLPRPTTRQPVDLFGAAALAATVVGTVLLADLLAGDGGRPGWAVPVLAGGTLAALLLWLVSARLARDPVLPARLLRRRGFVVPVLLSFTVGFALFGTLAYVPTFAQVALGTTATQAGFLVTALMAGALTTMTVSGRLITRSGRYWWSPVTGTALLALGVLLFGLLGASGGVPGLVAVLFLIGLGVGMVMQVVMLAAQNATAPADLGAVTSSVLFLRQVGASVGVALMGALITRSFAEHSPAGVAEPGDLTPETIAALPAPTRELVAAAFGTAVPAAALTVAPLLGVAFLLALALPALPLRTQAQTELDREIP